MSHVCLILQLLLKYSTPTAMVICQRRIFSHFIRTWILYDFSFYLGLLPIVIVILFIDFCVSNFKDETVRNVHTDGSGRASLTDFVCWANETKCMDELLEIVVQVCSKLCRRRSFFFRSNICSVAHLRILKLYVKRFSLVISVWDCIRAQEKLSSQS